MTSDLGFTCDPPTATLRLSGELDLNAYEQVTDLFWLVAACGCHDLELDLSGVSYVDAGTLYLLDAQRRRVTSDGGSFVVIAESSTYRTVCDKTRYVFLTVDGEDDGVPGRVLSDRGARRRLRPVVRRPQA
jgi:anti-anti-sigma factor